MQPTLKLVLPIVSLALFWTWESWRPWFGHGPGRWKHGGRNLLLALGNTVVLSLGYAAVVALAVDATEGSGLGLLPWLGGGPLVSLLLAILLLDGTMYLWHRANHRVTFLWRFHRTHHSDPAMDVTTATRFHIGEHTGAFLLRLALVPLLGVQLEHLVTYDLTLIVATQFHHADISLGRLDRWLRLLIVTPAMHKVHHSDLPAETDSNYGALFSFWDRLGRSHVVVSDLRRIRLGLRELTAERWQTLLGMLATPFRSPAHEDPKDAGGRR